MTSVVKNVACFNKENNLFFLLSISWCNSKWSLRGRSKYVRLCVFVLLYDELSRVYPALTLQKLGRLQRLCDLKQEQSQFRKWKDG